MVNDAKSYVNNAKVMFVQASKTRHAYYDEGAKAMMEVVKKYGK